MIIEADVDRCTACALCLLVCSYHQTGGFNPHAALLVIGHEETGSPKEIRFTHGCQTQPADPCAALAVPACVTACAFGALTLPAAAEAAAPPAAPSPAARTTPAGEAP